MTFFVEKWHFPKKLKLFSNICFWEHINDNSDKLKHIFLSHWRKVDHKSFQNTTRNMPRQSWIMTLVSKKINTNFYCKIGKIFTTFSIVRHGHEILIWIYLKLYRVSWMIFWYFRIIPTTLKKWSSVSHNEIYQNMIKIKDFSKQNHGNYKRELWKAVRPGHIILNS